MVPMHMVQGSPRCTSKAMMHTHKMHTTWSQGHTSGKDFTYINDVLDVITHEET